jgi:hypothetical protein
MKIPVSRERVSDKNMEKMLLDANKDCLDGHASLIVFASFDFG